MHAPGAGRVAAGPTGTAATAAAVAKAGTTAAVSASSAAAVQPAAMRFAELPPPYFRDPDRRAKLARAFPVIEQRITKEAAGQALPGLVVGIVIDGELAYAKGFGVKDVGASTAPTIDTIYRVGSITKSFTALALLSLRDAGVVRLDDELATWVPEARGLVYPTRDSRPITLRQLAHHTSGLPVTGTFHWDHAANEREVVGTLDGAMLEASPGAAWRYSNLGYGLLGIAVGNAAKTSYHDAVEARLLRPLGMTASGWDLRRVPEAQLAHVHVDSASGQTKAPVPARNGAVDGAGGLYSTVRDLARYVAFQLDAYPPRDATEVGPVRRATVREAHASGVFEVTQLPGRASAATYGLGWTRVATCPLDDRVQHTGSIYSYAAMIAMSPSRGVGVIVLSNFTNARTRAFVDIVFAELASTRAFVPRVPQPSPAFLDGMRGLLAVYHDWDEAALARVLARPVDPNEQAELAGYQQLHGRCSAFQPGELRSATSGLVTLTCERGSFEIDLSVDPAAGITGFHGLSRDITAPPAIAKTLRARLQRESTTSAFRERYGTCKVAGAIHAGADWGLALACTKGAVDFYVLESGKVTVSPSPGVPQTCD